MFAGLNFKSEFLKSVFLLTSGTVLAQLIHFGFQPIIARLFETEEIGELNFFLRIIAFFVSVGTLRYELAIPLPKKDQHAFHIVRVSLKIALYVTLLFLVGVGCFTLFNDSFLSQAHYYVFITIIMFLSIFRNIGLNYAIRKKWFKSISISKTFGALGMGLSKVGAGLLSLGVVGLIAVTLVGVLTGTIVYVKQYFNENKLAFNKSSKLRQQVLVKEHKNFPLMNLPHTLIDTSRELLIVFLFVHYYGKDVFGSFSFGLMVLSLPLALVGTTIGQAFFQKASESYNNNQLIYPILKKTTAILIALSIFPFGLVFFFGEEMFAWFFEGKWIYAGTIVEVTTPWIAMKFVSSPISTIPLIIKKQKLFFILGLVYTLIQLDILAYLPYVFGFGKLNVLATLNVLSIVMAVFLCFVIFVKLRLVKTSDLRMAELK